MSNESKSICWAGFTWDVELDVVDIVVDVELDLAGLQDLNTALESDDSAVDTLKTTYVINLSI